MAAHVNESLITRVAGKLSMKQWHLEEERAVLRASFLQLSIIAHLTMANILFLILQSNSLCVMRGWLFNNELRNMLWE